MFRDAPAILKEILVGFVWPLERLDAGLNWAIGQIEIWGPGQRIRAIEVIGILAAIFVVLWEFGVERPIEREVRAEERIARMWQLATSPVE